MSLLAPAQQGLAGLTVGILTEWATIFTLIFGGCCSNALTLEQLTRAHPHSGSLITFAQFVLISIHGLPTFLTTCRWHGIPLIRLRKRKIPLAPYLVQVGLFYGISLLNNMAFGYKIPMPVHIIFRSGGLVVSMVMGWAFAKKRYNMTQVASVFLVTVGVVITTLSASGARARSSPASNVQAPSTSQYLTGIAILSLALVLTGALGLMQDWTYDRYTRTETRPAAKEKTHTNGHANGIATTKTHSNGTPPSPSPPQTSADDAIQPWQESMFYLHFLALPMFVFVRHDLATQARALHASPPLALSLPSSLTGNLTLHPPIGLEKALSLSLEIPSGYVPLALTTLTSLVCVAGVNRLTARVSSLTVTLVLVIRKAVSMVVSVMLFGAKGGDMNAQVMWAGAALVFLGTMSYGAGSRKGRAGRNSPDKTQGGDKVKKE